MFSKSLLRTGFINLWCIKLLKSCINDIVWFWHVRELKDRLRGIAEVVVKDIEEAIQAHSPVAVEGADKPRVSPESKSAIIAQIMDVADSNNTIRKLVGKSSNILFSFWHFYT